MCIPGADGLSLFWGKARTDVFGVGGLSGPAMHPLVAHMLDVAAVAVLLPGWSQCTLDRRQIGFLVALHDIGKLMPGFQAKVPEHWPRAAFGPLSSTLAAASHDADGLALLNAMADAELAPLFGLSPSGRRWLALERGALFRAVAGHHGRPVAETRADRLDDRTMVWARRIVGLLFEVFRPPPIPLPDASALRRLEWRLAGLTVTADWIGSRVEWFPYVAPGELADPAAYFWNHALPRAHSAVTRAGLAPMAVAPFAGVGGLFDHISQPSPAQALAEGVALPDGPALIVIEDLTGSGKTEAALTMAHRLMAVGRGAGLFVALPTMATANAMYDRLATAYRRLFQPSAHPSLALAHGRASLDERFADALAPDDDMARAGSVMEGTAEAHCAAWLGSQSRRALMAQVGVGTIDQALMAVLPVRFATVRQQGLAEKILIVDECHAFDPYMRREMIELLRFHAAMGGSAILLSATLTRRVRQALIDAFRSGLGGKPVPLSATAYPLVTVAGGGEVDEHACAARSGLARSVAVRRLADVDAALGEVRRGAAAGAAVAWIRNSVDDVIETARTLRAQGVDVLVFHARFAMVDRLAIERDVLARFGKNGLAGQRAAVLMASQVIEQSLDLDFDLLCTDLAPMDLLIQRAGRLWRHSRAGRPVAALEMLVVSPEPVAEPDGLWVRRVLPRTAAVYRDPALLWRTARALFARGCIDSPGEIRALIEAAGDDDTADAVPEALLAANTQETGRGQAQATLAAQNVLAFDRGYAPETAQWEAELATPTRLQEIPQVTVRLAVVRDGVVVPWALEANPVDPSDLRRAWALSEVSVAQYRLASCHVPVGLESAVTDARSGWSRWEREAEQSMLLLVLRETGKGWRGDGRNEKGEEVVVGYDRVYGFMIVPANAG
ncbi:CRISPR-associated helicase Cas3' [Gluconacetobacter takamatsuzukensis]|uniref:CRISPR-associated helicase Cas3' n=1 Tax=Gluconacetobacter takamatsuzukensis TaxID=1286190 RepID=UPI0030845DF0